MKNLKYIGTILLIVSIAMAFVWYGWQLGFIIWLALAGNNLEQKHK
jgi:D-alanyl-lipoteichoic acid acyltransferase DltB (MBOAT superfamily)